MHRQRDQVLSTLRVNADDPGYIADSVFDRLVYGGHPYGLPGTGSEAELGSLTRADLETFHRQWYVPNNMVLAIVGDVTSDEAFAAAEKAFGGWPRGVVPEPTYPEPPAPTRRLVIIDKIPFPRPDDPLLSARREEIGQTAFSDIDIPIANQGACGSCWAFAVTAAEEAANIIANPTVTGIKMKLSEQLIMDCNSNGYGCGGGSPYNVANWLISTQQK